MKILLHIINTVKKQIWNGEVLFLIKGFFRTYHIFINHFKHFGSIITIWNTAWISTSERKREREKERSFPLNSSFHLCFHHSLANGKTTCALLLFLIWNKLKVQKQKQLTTNVWKENKRGISEYFSILNGQNFS